MDNDGDGNKYVPRKEFDTFRKGNADLCMSYRNALEDKVNGMEKSIKMAIYFASAILGVISVSVQLYLHLISA